MTVTGEVAGSELGVALPLEHLSIDLVRDSRGDGLPNVHACLRSNLREAVAPAN
jgi:predicted metal-dependent phosphotriesterase family hydrolase